jgi:hypothetical protein
MNDVIPNNLKERVITAILSSSRTARGISDTSSSKEKQKLAASPAVLTAMSRRNISELLDLFTSLMKDSSKISSERIYSSLITAAGLVNKEMGNAHSSIWRTWPGKNSSHYRPEDIQYALKHQFSPWLAMELGQLSKDTVREVAAQVEIRFNGEIRPFVDGCGRISRSLSGALLATYELVPPTMGSISGDQEYYKDFKDPWERWRTWFKNNITTLDV